MGIEKEVAENLWIQLKKIRLNIIFRTKRIKR